MHDVDRTAAAVHFGVGSEEEFERRKNELFYGDNLTGTHRSPHRQKERREAIDYFFFVFTQQDKDYLCARMPEDVPGFNSPADGSGKARLNSNQRRREIAQQRASAGLVVNGLGPRLYGGLVQAVSRKACLGCATTQTDTQTERSKIEGMAGIVRDP